MALWMWEETVQPKMAHWFRDVFIPTVWYQARPYDRWPNLQKEVDDLLRLVDYWKQKALKGENATEFH